MKASKVLGIITAILAIPGTIVAVIQLTELLEPADDTGGKDSQVTELTLESETLALELVRTDLEGCQRQMIDLDQQESHVVDWQMAGFSDIPDGADLLWDTCDDDWNLTANETGARANHIRSDAEHEAQDCQSAADKAPQWADWEFTPTQPQDSDLAPGTAFCVWTTEGRLARMIIDGDVADGIDQPVAATVTTWLKKN